MQLGESDPKRRLPWFGPDMGVRMFTTARLMETWAHGQEVYDLMRVERTHTDRIKHIATIGMKTFGWTFVNRGLEVPGAPPYVRLVAPSGEIWEWNEPSESERISGDAVDFCQVVTQGRNIADTPARGGGRDRDPLDVDRPVLRRRAGGSAEARRTHLGVESRPDCGRRSDS